MPEYPKWVSGSGVVVGGDEDGKKLTGLSLLVNNEREEKSVKAGTARLEHVKDAQDDVLGVRLKR